METKRAAGRIGVFGWVRNRRDGAVEAVFEGDRERVEAILDWCREGPAYARVVDVKVNWNAYKGEFDDFKITY
jgi:acylphosphatase